MNEKHIALKNKYVFVGAGEPVPRTKIAEDKTRGKVDLVRREALWLGTLNVKKPENGFKMIGLPELPDPSRTPFHVAAKNYPIPEPPKMFQYPSNLGKNLLHKPEEYTRKPGAEEIERDMAEKSRDELVATFNKLQKRTKIGYGTVLMFIKGLETLTTDVRAAEEKIESWKRKYAYLQKKQHALKKQREEALQIEEHISKKPVAMREENRELRQTLYNLEAVLVKRKEEIRKLKLADSEGASVVELRQVKSLQVKTDKKMLELAQERQDLQKILERASGGLSDQISGLIQTNGHLFEQTGTLQTPSTLNYDHNNNIVDPRTIYSFVGQEEQKDHNPESSTQLAIEKARIRRMQVETKVKDLEGKLSNFKIRKLLLLPPTTPDDSNHEINLMNSNEREPPRIHFTASSCLSPFNRTSSEEIDQSSRCEWYLEPQSYFGLRRANSS